MNVTNDEVSEASALLSGQIGEEPAPVEEPEDTPADDTPSEPVEDTGEAGDEPPDIAAESPDTYTMKELSDAIEWPVESLYTSVMIPLDDGQEPVSVGDLKNNYQNLVRDNAALKTQAEASAGLLSQAQTGANQGQQMSQQMIEAQGYLQSIERMEQGINWAELEELDPTEAVLKRDKFRRAKDETMQTINQINAQQSQAQQAYLQQASVKMMELIPSWKDDTVKLADQSAIQAHMTSSGFNGAEINQIADPRIMFLLKELIDLRAEKTAASGALKKVNKAPKVLTSVRGMPKQNANDRTAKMVAKAKKTGNKHDQLDAVKQLLRG